MKNTFLTFIVFILTINFFGQKTAKDTLRTDEVIVVKPYTPKISDAFKIKDNPQIKKSDSKKEAVTYTFFSFPVASTFTPTTGTAKSVVREQKEKIYDDYVAGGFGNYSTPYLEAFAHMNTTKYNDFGAFIRHISSSGGIKDILVDDGYSDTNINLYYQQTERDYDWQINGGTELKSRNWYGLPKGITYDPIFLEGLDVKQKYLNIFAGGSLSFVDGSFKEAKFDFNHFSDDYSSSELHAIATSNFEFDVASQLFTADVSLEYLSSKFEMDYLDQPGRKHSLLNLGFSPNYELLRDDLAVNIGGRVYYSFDFELDKNYFYFYPNITASYKLIENNLIILGGITGDFTQNTYQQFVDDNPFISPTITLEQTDERYKAYLGAKGKLTSNIGYTITAAYINEKNKALFISNPSLTDGIIPALFSYQSGNSLGIVYDDVKTINVLAGINIDLSEEFKFGGEVEYNNYSTTNQGEAWNLPSIKSTLFATYNTKKWYAGSDIYVVGNRKDLVTPFGVAAVIKDLNTYVDVNLNGGYLFTERITAFIKFNNVLSANYERYSNFEVQGFQVLGGVIYKFNL